MSVEASSARLLKVLKEKINPENKHDTMIFGTVKSVDPIQIEIYNGLILEEGQLFLGQMCRPYKVKIPHTHIVDTHFSEKSTSIGTHAGGTVSGGAVKEQIYNLQAKTNQILYKTLDDEGNEINNQISEEELGRGNFQSNITVGGSASIATDLIEITDNKHKHIIPKQITKDVHFPKSDYEKSVTIEIEPKLQKDDIVLLFAFNNFQKFYVAERIEKEE